MRRIYRSTLKPIELASTITTTRCWSERLGDITMTNWQRDENEYWPDHIEIPENDWLFTKEQLADSVSVRAGLSRKEELAKMDKMYRFMHEIGGHDPVMFFSVIYLQRYFQRVPVTQGNPYHICVVMIFLASRVLEQHRPGPDLALKGAKVALGNQQISKQSKDFWIWRDELVKNEMLVMDKLCCDFILYNPWEELRRTLVKNKSNENEMNQADQDVVNFWKSMHHEVPLPAHSLRLMGKIAYTQVYLVFRIQDVMIAMLIASAIHYKLKWPKHFFEVRGIRVNIATLIKIYKFIHQEQNMEMRKPDYQGFNISPDDIKAACNEDFEGVDDILDSRLSTPSKSRIDPSDDLTNTRSFSRISQEPRESARTESSIKLIEKERSETPFKMVVASSTAPTPTSLKEQTVKSKGAVQPHSDPKDVQGKDLKKAGVVSKSPSKLNDSSVKDESKSTARESSKLDEGFAHIEPESVKRILSEPKDQCSSTQQIVVDNAKNKALVQLIDLGDSKQREAVGQPFEGTSAKRGYPTLDEDYNAVAIKVTCKGDDEVRNEDSGKLRMETEAMENLPYVVKEEQRDVNNDRDPALSAEEIHTPESKTASSLWKPVNSHSLKATQGIPHLIAPLPKMKEKPKEITNSLARANTGFVGSIKKSQHTSATLSERPLLEKPSTETPLTEKRTSRGSVVEQKPDLSLNIQIRNEENSREIQSSSFGKKKKLHSDIHDLKRPKKSYVESPLKSLDSTTLERTSKPEFNKSQFANRVSLDSGKNMKSEPQSVLQEIREEAGDSAARTKTSDMKERNVVAKSTVPGDASTPKKEKSNQQSGEQERKRRLRKLIGHIDELDGHLDDLK